MDRTNEQWQLREGTEVVGADGDKVGKVIAVHPDYVVVEKGFFFPTDYFIPTSAIANYDGDKAYLAVTKDEALNSGWDMQPDSSMTYDASGTATYDAQVAGLRGGMSGSAAADAAAGLGLGGAMGASSTSPGLAGDLTGSDDLSSRADYSGTVPEMDPREHASADRVSTDDSLRIPVHEEELIATKREREVGDVRINKEVRAEEQTLAVPVTEERVRVTRTSVNRDASAGDDVFTEGTIEVPVRAEEVDLQKRVRVAEEVEIDKEAVQREERVTGTVRREEVNVDTEGLESDPSLFGEGREGIESR